MLAICNPVFAEEIQPYQRYIGLGNACLTRFQINTYLTKKFEKKRHAFGGGQLFDWLVIHDYEKLCDTIENDLLDLFEKSDLVVGPTWAPAYRCVLNTKHHMTWNHLFSRNWDGSINENIIEMEYDVKKQKIDYLSQKFKSLADYRTLYIISYPTVGAGELLTIEPDLQTLIRLQKALEKMRGNDNFNILYCPAVKRFDDFEKIFVEEIPLANVIDFQSILQVTVWEKMFSKYPFIQDEDYIPQANGYAESQVPL